MRAAFCSFDNPPGQARTVAGQGRERYVEVDPDELLPRDIHRHLRLHTSQRP
jgi:hypothetical protein